MQTYRIEQDSGPSIFKVLVGRKVAGHVIACAEHPGLWRIEDQGGRFMGRAGMREEAAAFLATWFGAEEQDWS